MCGSSIPKYILDLPQDILSTQLGQTLGSFIGKKCFSSHTQSAVLKDVSPTEQIAGGTGTETTFSFEPQIAARHESPGFNDLNTEIEAARLQSLQLDQSRSAIKDKLAKKEKKKDKKKKKHHSNDSESNSNSGSNGTNMSDVDAAELNGAAAVNAVPQEMRPSQLLLEEDAREREEEEERRKNREPAVAFKDIDVSK